MWGIIDIIIIVFVVLSAIGGYKKGLISLGIHLFAFILALLISFVLYRPIGNIIINTTPIDETIQAIIENNASAMVTTENTTGITNKLIESAKEGVLPEVSKELSYNIVYGATMIVLFLLLRVCLMLVSGVANAISKLPILDQTNKLGGAVYGVIRGIFITYLVLMIIKLIIVVDPQTPLNTMLNETYLAKTMLENNILNMFF